MIGTRRVLSQFVTTIDLDLENALNISSGGSRKGVIAKSFSVLMLLQGNYQYNKCIGVG